MNALPIEMAEEPLVTGKQGQTLMVESQNKSQLLQVRACCVLIHAPLADSYVEIYELIP